MFIIGTETSPRGAVSMVLLAIAATSIWECSPQCRARPTMGGAANKKGGAARGVPRLLRKPVSARSSMANR